ncbi:hypothetical protein RhiirA4_431571 [Rhizophagus irregularis]|uniref:Uncharacterized protein n=1 Tax=Rhizophagus irregularis TaxID=588596 RepID=A0A2I1HQC1_9GLOM|nr:hypothetical protein RhiirA4_431571 [Rhizophagus irregularis]
MWCSRIRVPFRKLIEYNPTFFSKNEYIHMTERLYEDEKFGPGRRTFHIYCTACDSLVFICENTEKCADKHLNECIAKIEERHIAYVRSVLWKRKSKKGLSSIEIDEIYHNIYYKYRKSSEFYDYRPLDEFKRKTAYHYINSAIAIQRVWRAFKLGPETWAQRVWNIVRNDGTPDRKRLLGELPSSQRIIINPETQEEYALRVGEFVDGFKKNCIYIENFNLAELVTPYKEYIDLRPTTWIENKKHQLLNRLSIVAYIVAFIVLHQQGYRNVKYGGWSCQLKCLSNPEYYRINQYDGTENFVRSSEYTRYKCKEAGKQYPCDLLEINYFKSAGIDFSNFNNNCEYVQRVFQNIR